MHKRPKQVTTEYYRPWNPLPIQALERYAIVLQGPLLLQEDFTLETIRYYRALHPDAIIILSTWKGEDAHTLKLCEEAGVEIVTSERPMVVGAFNINLQATSTLKGLERAQELKCRFAAKTRTDMRIYAPNIWTFLSNLMSAFPLTADGIQSRRIISTNLCTARYTPFFLSDLFLFGEVEDLIRYWSCPVHAGGSSDHCEWRIKDLTPEIVPEVYLCRSYLERTVESVDSTLSFWWKALAERFLIVDVEMLDLYWPKYHPHTEHTSLLNEPVLGWNTLRFRDWLQLFLGLNADTSVPERFLDLSCKSQPPLRWPEA
ncbi:MAG: WavE lipopolysaccharide synthesis family protein [Planctomycetia bacterium]|nr:WavE lipopolysaccharide synthesis family protein [Planctomycetia bacterium]